jgi:hypothetical protein
MRAASEADTKTAKAPTRTVLDTIERIGNSVPHPVVIFLLLIAIAVIASHLLYLLDASVSYQVINPATHGAETVTTRANSLLIWSSRRQSRSGRSLHRYSCRYSCSWPSIPRRCWPHTASETAPSTRSRRLIPTSRWS